MKLTTLCTTAAMTLAAAPLWADATPATMTYEQFEAAVPHMDLENCPEALAQENVFCRATLQHEEIHVFVFSQDGDSPFVGFKTYPADGMAALLK